MEEAKVEMNDSPDSPSETLEVKASPAPITAKDVWTALECVQKKHRRYLVPAMRKLYRVPPEVFEKIRAGTDFNKDDYGLTESDLSFVLAVINYCES